MNRLSTNNFKASIVKRARSVYQTKEEDSGENLLTRTCQTTIGRRKSSKTSQSVSKTPRHLVLKLGPIVIDFGPR